MGTIRLAWQVGYNQYSLHPERRLGLLIIASGQQLERILAIRIPPRQYHPACLLPIGVALLLAGCAHYSPLPLVTKPPLAATLATLDPASTAQPLKVEQVVALALVNNPDLKALRLKREIASGQTRQAGILPNPSFSGAFLPLLSGAGSVPAWNLALSQDIKSLVTYRTRRRAAADTERQVAADVVWQEWQVAGQARLLATDLIMGARMRAAAFANYRLLIDRNVMLETALAQRTVTLAAVAPDRVALQSARTALDAVDQRQLALVHQLNALLGLHADVLVPLAGTIELPPFDAAGIRAGLDTLADRRPDLIALRLGYAAADEQVRQAILAQFPDLILGATGSSDNSQVINAGPTAQIGLPLFDRNQGNVAIARATRAQLHADYSARLAGAIGTVEAMLAEMAQLSGQLALARHDLPATRSAADQVEAAFVAGNVDARTAVDLISNRFAKEQDIMTLEQALLDRQIAVQTLTGAGLPQVNVAAAQPAAAH